MSTHSLTLFADYHQFYLWDSGTDPQAPEDYTDDDVHTMVKLGPNVVVIQPVRNTTVPVELEIFTEKPLLDLAAWDHVVECSLDLPTGSLQVHECTGGPALDLLVRPGTYRVVALFSGLAEISDDGLDGKDHYRLLLWPAPPVSLRVLKQWAGAGNASTA